MGTARSIELANRVLGAPPGKLDQVERVLDEDLAVGHQAESERALCQNMPACLRAAMAGGLARCVEAGGWCRVVGGVKGVYRLWRGHRGWNLVLRGEREVLGDDRGAELVEYLLKNPPPEAIHASVLEDRVDGSPVIGGFGGIEPEGGGGVFDGAVGGVIQEGAGRRLLGGSGALLRKKVAELHAEIGDVTLPASEREAAQEELDELVRSAGRGGKMIGGAGRSVERVRKAIWRLITELKTAEVSRGKPNTVLRAFGEHLERYLWLPSMGAKGRAGASGRPGCFIYEPPTGVVWGD